MLMLVLVLMLEKPSGIQASITENHYLRSLPGMKRLSSMSMKLVCDKLI